MGTPDVRFALRCVSASRDRREAQDLLIKLWNREGTIAQANQWLARLKEIAPRYFHSHPGGYLERRVAAQDAYERVRAQVGDRPSRAQLVTLVSKLQYGEGTEEDQEAWLWVLYESIPNLEVRYWPSAKLPAGRTATDMVEQAFAGHPLVFAV